MKLKINSVVLAFLLFVSSCLISLPVSASNTMPAKPVTIMPMFEALDNSKEITSFALDGKACSISGTNISLKVSQDADVSNLTPIITHTGARISPVSGIAQDFTNPVTYTVTAADGSFQDYTVNVIVIPSLGWEFEAIMAAGVNGVNTSTPDIYYSPSENVAISASANSGYKFKEWQSSVTYVIFADVNSANTTFLMPPETVTITPVFEALATDKEITSFALDGNVCSISGTNISLTVPHGVDVSNLTSVITHTGVSVSPVSGIAQDFTNPVTYTVTAEDGSTQDYAVTVTILPSTTKEITAFAINSVNGSISGNNINIKLPYGTDLTNLTPTISHNGTSISPNGAQDFTNPVTYTVTAADGSTQDYTVNVTVLPATTKEITAFAIDSINGNISGNNINITLPYGTDLTNLTPTISHTGASISPNGAQDFTNPVTYTVTAADGSTQDYVVKATLLFQTKNPEVSSVDGINLDLNGQSTSSFTLTLGQSSGGGSLASGVDIVVDDNSVADIQPTALVSDGIVNVTAKKVGKAVITITFKGSREVVTIPVTVIDSTPIIISTITSSSGRNSGSGNTIVDKVHSAKSVDRPLTKDIVESLFKKAISDKPERQNKLSIQAQNYSTVDKTVLEYAAKLAEKSGVNLTIHVDTVQNGVVTLRKTINPKNTSENINLKMNAEKTSIVTALFEKQFSNNISTVIFNAQGELGYTAKVAVKPNKPIENPTVYSYNTQTGTYKKLTNSNVRVDKNGYIHFDTTIGGDFIISGGELTKK